MKAQIEKWEREHSKALVVNGQKFMEHGTVGDASIRERMGQAGKGK